jgi:hypothetical protein
MPCSPVRTAAPAIGRVATAKLNGVEPQVWLTDVLERLISGRTKATELVRLLLWTWQAERLSAAVTAQSCERQTMP